MDGADETVLWIKGSGGDIGSIQRSGFATLHLNKLHALEHRYRGVEFEDEMVGMYPLCTFGENPLPLRSTRRCTASFPSNTSTICIPIGASRLAAAANGREKMEEFNRQFAHKLSGCRGSGRALSWP